MFSLRSHNLLLLLLCGVLHNLHAQQYTSRSAEIKFASKAELELIKASSNKIQGIIDIPTRKFAFLVNISTFQGFNSDLQRKHFNENYLESDKYAAAKFSGKIIEDIDLKVPGTYEVRAKGEMEIHGVKQVRIIKGKVTVKENELQIETEFTVPLADHNITIPKIVSQKIATEIVVEFSGTFIPQS